MMRASPKSCLRPSLIGLAAALVLSGCGGGGNGGSEPPPPPQPNQAPTFTSQAAVSVPENSSGTIYTATATDPDGNPLTFSLAGGADQAAFRISSAGALSFATPPDFEDPGDADGDNVYMVSIGVSDGMASAALSLAVTVTNAGGDSFRVTRVGAGFNQPLFVAPVPGSNERVFVVEKGGTIRILNPDGSGSLFLDISSDVSSQGERGLLGLATAADFATSGIFYVYVTNPAGDIEIRRYRTPANDRNSGDPATKDVILSFPHPQFTNHNGGWLAFGPDGFLYAASGDGGGAGDPNDNAQNTNVLLGKMLRIDVSSDDFPSDASRDYGIPSDNPFAGGGGRPEIWAFGLRNPFRNSFDPATGNLLIGDVGQNAIEEVDLMRPDDGGANFGWPFLEGTRPFRGGGPASLVPPVTEYPRGDGPLEGRSITGGYVYRGPVEQLQGLYIFGDFVTGNLWSIPVGEFVLGMTVPNSRYTVRRMDFAPNEGAIDNISSFGLDGAGNLYIVDFDGEIFRLEAG